MNVNYNVKGAQRKALVKAIESITGEKAVYLKTPTYNYEVGQFTVTVNGSVECDNFDDLERLTNDLAAEGFVPEDEIKRGKKKVKVQQPSKEIIDDFSVTIPADKVNMDNFWKLIDAKGALIKKSLGIDTLSCEIDEERNTVTFPWFKNITAEDSIVYARFITFLCDFSYNATRVNSKEYEVENEKYAFRCFLLRLGYVGDEYKEDRKVLLKNLSGCSAWRNGQKGGSNDDVSE